MAVILPSRNPIDTKARKAVGVALPFDAPGVFVSTYTTAQQLKSNLMNYFMTDTGERFMNVDFGMGLRRVLFQQLSDATYSEVKKRIEKDVERYFPAVQLLELSVFGKEDNNILQIEFKYRVKSFAIEDTLVINLNTNGNGQ